MKDRHEPVSAVLDGIQADGLPGVFQTMYRMIGENQPSIECLREADDALASAADSDQVWDALLDLAQCLRTSGLIEEPPEPPEPPDPPPPPPPPPPVPPRPDRADEVADVVFAALLVNLWDDQGQTKFPVRQESLRK
jgi:hypothetical protein